MGKVLTLPRTHEQIDRVARYYPDALVPDFAARLHIWRQADAERRERFRRDIGAMCELAQIRSLLFAIEPQEGA